MFFQILDAKGETKGAIALLQKAATLEPDSKTIQQDLAKLIIKQRREEHNEKEMYQKMLGQAKKLENKPQSKQRPQSTDVTKVSSSSFVFWNGIPEMQTLRVFVWKNGTNRVTLLKAWKTLEWIA